MNNDNGTSYKIRPAGRHILTIGENLIEDKTAAIVELVKNSYDADSPCVQVNFTAKDEEKLEITITDQGCGMSLDDVVNKWLVPSTPSKVNMKLSPKGRIIQGKKGIGRYATGILGDSLLLETVDTDGVKTSALLIWKDFEKAEYLDDVAINVDSHQSNEASGTKLTIEGGPNELDYWTENRKERLITDLRKLIPPKADNVISDDFDIELSFTNVPYGVGRTDTRVIEPLPLLDACDYRIYGTIDASGKQELYYLNQKNSEDTKAELIDKEITKGSPTGCGTLQFDFKVFDREIPSLDLLLKRGTSLDDSLNLTRQDARSLLNEMCGVGVYRGGFRIRPLGDPGNDWLKLDARRVQNPSMRIGSNQIVGYIHIEDEEASGLEEKSARDGLKDNDNYERLHSIAIDVLSQLEERRFRYRRKVDGSKGTFKENLQELQDYSALSMSVEKELKASGVEPSVVSKIGGLIKKEEKEKRRYAKRVTEAVDAYRGQATLGSVVEILLHEGRKPLGYLNDQSLNLVHYVGKLDKTTDNDSLTSKIVKIGHGIHEHADKLTRLFARIEPLTTRRRSTAKLIPLSAEIEKAFLVFERQLADDEILYDINVNPSITYRGWREDIYNIFVNLIENSIYWISQSGKPQRKIEVSLNSTNPLQLDYFDTGSGIPSELITESIIFDPGYSGRNGTGLGLTIAGDSAARSGLTLKALESADGAHFRLEESHAN